MIYALVIYALGFAVMTLGFLMSPEFEKRDAHLLPTMMAYACWPVSLIAVLTVVLWEKAMEALAAKRATGPMIRH